MTDQMMDLCRLRGDPFHLIGHSGGGPLFVPTAHGIQPTFSCTACHRGFRCEYEVRGDRFLLDRVLCNHGESRRAELPPPLAGHPAVPPSGFDADYFGWEYRSLSMPVAFTGGVLIGSGCIEQWWYRIAVPAGCEYTRVVELEIAAGQVIGLVDRRDEFARLRDRIGDLVPDGRWPDGIALAITACCSRRYRRSV